MTAVDHVAVVGAGVAGLAAAIRLADAGVRVDLFDAHPELNALGSGISLQANALIALDALGIWDEASAAGYAFDELLLRAPGPTAPIIARRSEERDGKDRLPSGMGMPRRDLARILFARASSAGVRPRFGNRVTGTRPEGDLVALIAGEETLGRYDLVIGADGLHSAIRADIGITTAPEHTGMGIWRAFVSRPEPVTCTELFYGGPAYIAGYTPTSQDSMYAFLVFDAEERGFELTQAEGAQLMIERSAAYGGPWDEVRADLEAGTAIVNYTWFTKHIVSEPWHRGRVVIIGDAAHSCPPTIAQGAAQALEDATVLTELLVREDRITDDLWSEFHRRRLPKATAVVEASVQLAEWQRDGEDHSAEMPQLLAGLSRRLAEVA